MSLYAVQRDVQANGAALDCRDMSPLSLHGRQAESDLVNSRASGAGKR